MERGNTRLTKNAWATVICVKDEDTVIWSTGDNLTTASFDGIFVTQNRRIKIAHRHIRSSVILKTASFHESYLGNAMINIWTVGFVEYFPGIRIVFTGGYVIEHEDYNILVLQAPSPQDLIRMANVSLQLTLMTKLLSAVIIMMRSIRMKCSCAGRSCVSASVPDGGNCHNLKIQQLELPNEFPSWSCLPRRFSLQFFHPKVSATGSRNSQHTAPVTKREAWPLQNP